MARNFDEFIRDQLANGLPPPEADLYDGRVAYQPRFVFRKDSGGKNRLVGLPVEDLRNASKLVTPEMTRASTYDSLTKNIVYVHANGTIRMGFYDRSLIATSAPSSQSVDAREMLCTLVQGKDPECPRVPLLEAGSRQDVLPIKNPSASFNYRNVLFPHAMPFGVFVDVDKSLLGRVEVVKQRIDAEWIEKNQVEASSLLPYICNQALQEGIAPNELEVCSGPSGVNVAGIFGLKGMYLGNHIRRFHTDLEYTRVPGTSVLARLNGFPLLVSYSPRANDFEIVEISSGGQDLSTSFFTAISRAVFHNRDDPAKSGDALMEYHVINRDESIAKAAQYPSFGLCELVVHESFRLTNARTIFTKTEDRVKGESSNRHNAYSDTILSWTDPLNPNYFLKRDIFGGMSSDLVTIGEAALRDTRTCRIDAEHVFLAKLLLRDAFCLVHRETRQQVRPYG